MTTSRSSTAIVVGAGIFGITAALELRQRGYAVTLLDPGPVPHPLAASTDISKVVRIEYGADETYTRLAEEARAGWLAWNRDLFPTPLYHETGATFLTRQPMTPGGYEYENFRMLSARSHAPQRLDSAQIRRRFPAWNADLYVDGYLNPKAGYVESGKVVARLADLARSRGIAIRTGQRVTSLEPGTAPSVRLESEPTLVADAVVVTVGAWTPTLFPQLAPIMRPVGQPVFHLLPPDPWRFSPPHFVVFGADSSRTGWYGFPVHPETGVLKIANHGPGHPVHPDAPRTVSARDEQRLRAFLRDTFPEIAAAPLVGTRCCLYCDTPDEHFWIDRHPEMPGVTVAAGDSGHAFKFAPLLGRLVADAAEGKPSPAGARFAWRTFPPGVGGSEASRYRGPDTKPIPATPAP